MNTPADIKYIVLLHGFLSSSKYWKKITPYLSKAGYNIVTIDLLGFGKAPKPRNSVYDYDAHIAYIASCIDKLDISQPFVIIGHSMGGLLAARYAQLYVSKVSEVILLNPPLYIDSAQAYVTLRETGVMYRLLLDSRYRRIGWTLLRLSAFRFIKSHSHTSRELSLENVIQKPQIFDDLAHSTTKTLVIVGARDRPVYVANLPYLTKNPLVTISVENVNHHSPMKNPVLIQQIVLDFIRA